VVVAAIVLAGCGAGSGGSAQQPPSAGGISSTETATATLTAARTAGPAITASSTAATVSQTPAPITVMSVPAEPSAPQRSTVQSGTAAPTSAGLTTTAASTTEPSTTAASTTEPSGRARSTENPTAPRTTVSSAATPRIAPPAEQPTSTSKPARPTTSRSERTGAAGALTPGTRIIELRKVADSSIAFVNLVLVHPDQIQPYYSTDPKDPRPHTAPITPATQFFSGFGLCGDGQSFTFDDAGLGTTPCTHAQVAAAVNAGRISQMQITVGQDGVVTQVREMFHP